MSDNVELVFVDVGDKKNQPALISNDRFDTLTLTRDDVKKHILFITDDMINEIRAIDGR